jgi:hypothetical protein
VIYSEPNNNELCLGPVVETPGLFCPKPFQNLQESCASEPQKQTTSRRGVPPSEDFGTILGVEQERSHIPYRDPPHQSWAPIVYFSAFVWFVSGQPTFNGLIRQIE